jgi:hypothetical protein
MVDHVIVLSEKSSGSSVFQSELLKHSMINGVDWTSHTEHETLYWLKAANVLGFPAASFWASRPPFPARYSARSIRRLLTNNLDTSEFAARELDEFDWDALRDGWEGLIERFGPVFIEKSPHHLNQWPALSCIDRFARETTKSVKFVGLVRNPLSVVYSTLDRWYSDPYERQFMWENSYRNLLALRATYPPEQFLTIRYEDLIDDPPKEFMRVLGFLGLDYEPAVGAALHRRSKQKWLSDERFSFSVHPQVREMGRRFGYSDDEMICLKANVSAAKPVGVGLRKLAFAVRSRINFYRTHVS